MSARDKLLGTKTKDSVSLLPCFYFVELPILVSFVVSLYFLEWTDVFKPVKTGYNCNDRSLSLPYIDPNHEVIPLLMLLSLVFAGPSITIMIGEAILFCCLSRRKSGAGAEANINAAGCNFNSFIRRAVRFVGVHAFGLCATALITDILQLMTGHPTPYFLTVCKPNYIMLNFSCEQNPYIMEDICSGSDSAAINQGRKSFPSQHATLASFAAVYVSMYFNSTLTDSSKLLKPLLVFSFIISAIICGLTRIVQYKNHAVDVYLGFLIGGAVAVYLGLYAVGNFQPSEDTNKQPTPQLHRVPYSLPQISQEAVLHHLQMKATMAGEQGIPTSYSEGLLHRGPQQQRPDDNLKHPGADMELITPNSLPSKDAILTFSHTLPRVHTSQAMAAYEEVARHHAATLHHSSMDSSRSKQLLSQWKSKNNNYKCALRVPDPFSSSVDSSSTPSTINPHHHGSMELRSNSDPSAMGLDRGYDNGNQAYIGKLAAGSSTTLPTNCSGITGGTRIPMQSRPGSSQLVHIPEESNENYSTSLTTVASGENERMPTVNSTVQANWQTAAEKTVSSRSNDSGQTPQPRIMQVAAMSKQQGLLQTHSKSLDESSVGYNTAGSCQGSIHYKMQNDQDPNGITGPSSLGSNTGSISGSTGAIIRVEAHPENNKPVIQAPSTDGSGSWRWRSLDHGTGSGGGGGGGGSLKQSFDLSDLNRDSESSESIQEGSVERKHAKPIITTTASVSTPPVVAVHTQTTSKSEHKLHHQGLSTIRVTPGDGSVSGSGGGGETVTEAPVVASSRDSTLRRTGNSIILIPERSNSPDNTRNIFYKGTSLTQAFKE